MPNKAAILAAFAFLVAAGLSYLMAMAVGLALESRSQRHVQRALATSGLDWVEVKADGLLVTLKGTAPSEALRYRAGIVAGRVVGASRILDELDVTPSKPLNAPRFSLELLRNDDGVSVIGLAPDAWDPVPFLAAAKTLADEDLTNMVETADFPVPEHWAEAIDFGLEAMRLLPRSKISIAADGVKVHAIADSPDQKHAFESSLSRAVPRHVPVNVQISAPRAVITPFTLRFVMENGAARFDACSADTERARMRITAAGRRAGVPGAPVCVLGLGVPTPSWAEAAELLIGAMKELGAGAVTMSDVDVTLIADATVAQADFDRVVGELTTRLPDVFSLKATLAPKPQAEGAEGLAQFTAILSPEGQLQLRGRVTDERMRDMVDAFARARFGAQNVYVATRLDDQLPPTWGTRVLAALSALAEISHGSVLVEPEAVTVRGTTGNAGASAEISRLLSDRLGQGADYKVDVTYNERLDPSRGLPGPAECLARTETVLSSRQISFAPNSDEVVGEAARVVSTLAEELEDCAGARLEIGGHTDSQGRAESNLALSQRRAEAVLKGLAARGIDTSMMSAKGYGAAEPIADNATEEGRIANRRIQFKLLTVPGAQPIDSVVSPEDPEDDGEAIASIRPPSRPAAFAEIDAAPVQTIPEEAAPEARPLDDDEGMTMPELEEGDAPMGDAGDLAVGPDGEPVMEPEEATMPLSEEDLLEATPGSSSSPSAPTLEAAPEGEAPASAPASATEPEPEAAVAAPASAAQPDASAATQEPPAPVEGASATAPQADGEAPNAAPAAGEVAQAAPEASAPVVSTEAVTATETETGTAAETAQTAPEAASPATPAEATAAAPEAAPEAETVTQSETAAETAAEAVAAASPADAPSAAPEIVPPASEAPLAEEAAPALPWIDADPSESPQLRPQSRPEALSAPQPEAPREAGADPAPSEPAAAPEAPEALPLPPGWDNAPAVPDLRPLPRPKELAQ